MSYQDKIIILIREKTSKEFCISFIYKKIFFDFNEIFLETPVFFKLPPNEIISFNMIL